MAKKKQTEVAADAAPISDASIPTLAHSHKDPAQRAHVWERPLRVDERPAEPAPFADYKHELPRWVHKDGAQKFVNSPDECDAHLEDGWEIHPSGAK
jgi:hypothetical protein